MFPDVSLELEKDWSRRVVQVGMFYDVTFACLQVACRTPCSRAGSLAMLWCPCAWLATFSLSSPWLCAVSFVCQGLERFQSWVTVRLMAILNVTVVTVCFVVWSCWTNLATCCLLVVVS